ncbi:cysteine dioxygenase type 1 [Salpingoeca rosetta]|uniref:Cysteine dioxygenase n=1 Tax=Salpingoeca rosetta (strain ATCC 50818 / BSB-021) TaxID=946362 RepID=F2U4N8_SALR5|nr:cysteine dioxygenase type 1 [Salpingoeca rosetta]EGD82604.1 cysteine dioxygenase type 1 [Salpingoeca rosetta]|eukprot:XP_004995840.1 cysteine dioxygenase type 1 [Salpingoeca rosetta]
MTDHDQGSPSMSTAMEATPTMQMQTKPCAQDMRASMMKPSQATSSSPSSSSGARVEKESRTWDEMLQDLRTALDEDSVSVEHIHSILNSYKSRTEDWKQFAHFDDHCYTRNLVDSGNGKYNLMLLCWDMGQASSIHDHAGSHCFMKILDGNLVEELFGPPHDLKEGETLSPLVEAAHDRDGVLYISDKIGTHRVSNTSHSRRAVSLHLYSPPYSECHCFDERTGTKSTSGCISFYSEYGEVCCDDWKSGVAAKSADYC